MPESVTGPAYYFPSIEKKYGKPISYWLDLINSSELSKRKVLVDWLKADHGVGHGTPPPSSATPWPSAPPKAEGDSRRIPHLGRTAHEEDHRGALAVMPRPTDAGGLGV